MSLTRRITGAVRLLPASTLRPLDAAGAARPQAQHTFLIVDGQALVRHGVALTLMLLHPGSVALEASGVAEAEALLERNRGVELVLLDLDGLGEEWPEALARFAARLGPVPLVALSSEDGPDRVLECIRAGARGYVLKSGPSAVLEHAVALVLSGEEYIPLPRRALVGAARVPAPGAEREASAVDRLTGRQQDIFRLILAGYSNKEIARELGVLEGTVKVHVRAVMQKLGAKNRTQVAVVAARSGLAAG